MVLAPGTGEELLRTPALRGRKMLGRWRPRVGEYAARGFGRPW
jgi:hypothetical protein